MSNEVDAQVVSVEFDAAAAVDDLLAELIGELEAAGCTITSKRRAGLRDVGPIVDNIVAGLVVVGVQTSIRQLVDAWRRRHPGVTASVKTKPD